MKVTRCRAAFVAGVAKKRLMLTVFGDRYFTDGSVDPIAVVAGLVQTGLYLDFFYIYFTRLVQAQQFGSKTDTQHVLFRVLQGQKFELPA